MINFIKDFGLEWKDGADNTVSGDRTPLNANLLNYITTQLSAITAILSDNNTSVNSVTRASTRTITNNNNIVKDIIPEPTVINLTTILENRTTIPQKLNAINAFLNERGFSDEGGEVDTPTLAELLNNLENTLKGDSENDTSASETIIGVQKLIDEQIEAVKGIISGNVSTIDGQISDINDDISSLDERLEVIEGSGEGSVAKALADAKSYTDTELVKDRTRITTVEANIETINGDTTKEGSFRKAVADAVTEVKSYADTAESDAVTTANAYTNGREVEINKAIAAAEAAAKKDAADNLAAAVNTLANGQVATNTNAISAMDKAYKAADKTITDRVITLENKVNNVTNVMDFVGAGSSFPETAQKGDVFVINSGNDAGKEFVFDGTDWVEFGDISDLQLDDAHILLDGPYTFTQDFGYYTLKDGSTYEQYGEKGQTLRSFLEGAFSKVDNDVLISLPSFTVTFTNVTNSKEIGSKVTPKAKVTTSPGSYEYGTSEQKATGVTFTNIKINGSEGSTLNLDQITYTEDEQTLSVSATATQKAATNQPINNLQQTIAIPNSIAKDTPVSDDSSVTYTGYREGCFYGTVTTENFNASMIKSSVVRGLQKKTGKNYASATNLTYTVPVNATAILIAVPTGSTGPTSVLNTTVNAEMFGAYDEGTKKYGNFSKVTVSVGGADATATSVGDYATDYDVYYYIPANAYSSTAALQIDLGA